MDKTQTLQEVLSSRRGVAAVEAALGGSVGSSRLSLARSVYEELSLLNHRGEPRLAAVHKALRALEARDLWELPAVQGPSRRAWQPRRLEEPVPVPVAVPGHVEAMEGRDVAIARHKAANPSAP